MKLFSPRLLGIAAGAALVPVLAACAGSSSPSAPAAAEITASDTACALSTPSLSAGQTTFTIRNTGSKPAAVSVMATSPGAVAVVAVKDLAPGSATDATVDLPEAAYKAVCDPGQTGTVITSDFTVGPAAAGGTGSTASAGGTEAQSNGGNGGAGNQTSGTTADPIPVPVSPTEDSTKDGRVITFTYNGAKVTGLAGKSAKNNERIEFLFVNNSGTDMVFDVMRPDGTIAGEISVSPNQNGELHLTMDATGRWELTVRGGAKDFAEAFPVS